MSIRDIYSPPLCYTIDFWNFFKNSSEYWKIIISKSRDNKFRRRSNFEFRNARFHGRKSSRRKREKEKKKEKCWPNANKKGHPPGWNNPVRDQSSVSSGRRSRRLIKRRRISRCGCRVSRKHYMIGRRIRLRGFYPWKKRRRAVFVAVSTARIHGHPGTHHSQPPSDLLNIPAPRIRGAHAAPCRKNLLLISAPLFSACSSAGIFN